MRALEKILLMQHTGKSVELSQGKRGFTLPQNIGELNSTTISVVNLCASSLRRGKGEAGGRGGGKI